MDRAPDRGALGGRVALVYTEVPPSALDDPREPPGRWPGVALDLAFEGAAARLGCKPYPQNTCPIGWFGADVNTLFVRR